MTDPQKPDRWSTSVKTWNRMLSPFRPAPDDVAVVERVAGKLAAEGPLRVVTLGLTNEVVGCAWPEGTRLKAFDTSRQALQRLWPVAGAPPGASAAEASWLDLPVASASIDLVTADGSLVCVSYPVEISKLLEEACRILRPGGCLVARTFLRPEIPETLEAILADLEAGRIGNPYVLKIRIDALLHHDGLAGFSMREKTALWRELFPNQPAIAERFGWSPETLAIPGDYSVTDLRFTYPTLAELSELMAEGFVELECTCGTYQLAERCPTLVLERR